MKGSNWLAKIFEWNQQVIEAAETPFARLAIFVLPILSPVVPALLTALHIHKLLQIIFTGQWVLEITVYLAGIVGIVLELIGYVGAVLFIQAIYKFIQTRKIEYFLPMIINGLAYLFYLGTMYMINYRLGIYFETPEIMNSIVGLLSFITVPTGLLAANHLSQKQLTQEEYTIRQERREDSLKKKALDKGINIFGVQQQEQAPQREKKAKPASAHKQKILESLEAEYQKSGRVLSPSEITARLKIDHKNNKGYVSGLTSTWMQEKGIVKDKPNRKGNGLTF